MNVLIDTNVILDFILKREPHDADAALLFERLILSKSKVWLTASTITDIYYITRQALHDAAAAKNTIAKLLNTFQIAAVDKKDCLNALDSELDDYEDALVSICAQKAKAEYIITRNERHFEQSPVPALSPHAFLEQFYAV